MAQFTTSAGSGIRQETNLPVRELCTGGTDSGRAIEGIGELCFSLLVSLRVDAGGTKEVIIYIKIVNLAEFACCN